MGVGVGAGANLSGIAHQTAIGLFHHLFELDMGLVLGQRQAIHHSFF